MFIHLQLYKLVIQESYLNYCYCKLFYEHKMVTCNNITEKRFI